MEDRTRKGLEEQVIEAPSVLRIQHGLLFKLDCINTRHHVVSTLAKEIKDKIVDLDSSTRTIWRPGL
ncbi:hypothetical protein HanIR_Chr07g0332101 [Helianthus annuus]|nr:hypothetical protein HanIR_Chr07g0332101 [Helianthus annuus]